MLQPHNLRISSQQLISLVLAFALIFIFLFSPELLANDFVKELPKEVSGVKNKGLLSTIFTLIVAAISIACCLALFGIIVVTVKNASKVLSDIGENKQGASYGDLIGIIVGGVLSELVCIAFIYFGWQFVDSAMEIIG